MSDSTMRAGLIEIVMEGVALAIFGMRLGLKAESDIGLHWDTESVYVSFWSEGASSLVRVKIASCNQAGEYNQIYQRWSERVREIVAGQFNETVAQRIFDGARVLKQPGITEALVDRLYEAGVLQARGFQLVGERKWRCAR